MKPLATLLLLMSTTAFAADEAVVLDTPTGKLHGTLSVPAAKKKIPVALIIAGSGPTDRDGNSAMLGGPNDSLKMLAQRLGEKRIATLRFDKRGIAASQAAGSSEADLRFDMYVADASAWIDRLQKDRRFSRVYVIGHSEGSLIGMLAAKERKASGFVSIAGPARSGADILKEQLAGKLPPELAKESDRTLASLKDGKIVEDPLPALTMLYRPSVQPYLISWFRHVPVNEIAKLSMPVLVAQGTTDLQVSVSDAEALVAAKRGAKLAVIEGMNHVLKLAAGDMAAQLPTYSSNELEVAPKLVDAVVSFIHDSRD